MAFVMLSKVLTSCVLLAHARSTAGQDGPTKETSSSVEVTPPPTSISSTDSTTQAGNAYSVEPPGSVSSTDITPPPGVTPPTEEGGMSSASGTPPPRTSSEDRDQPNSNGEVDYDASQYPDMCNQAGYDADYDVYLSGFDESTVRQVISNTSCPNHVNYGVDKGQDLHFPARIYAFNASVPAYPQLMSDSYATDLSSTAGQIGILVNGVPMYSAFAGTPVTDWDSTAMAAEYDTFDACGAHSTVEGAYHTHGTPGCLLEQVLKFEGRTSEEHSPFLGWSVDGFPVYGPYGPDGVMMLLCGEDGADETYCLDACSGFEKEILDVDGFKYRYYLTCGFSESFYPGAVNCFRGCCPDGVECQPMVENCEDIDGDFEAGYTEDYVPELGLIITEQYDTDLLEGDDRLYINTTTSVDCPAYLNNTDNPDLFTPTLEPASITSSVYDPCTTGVTSSGDEPCEEADTSGGMALSTQWSGQQQLVFGLVLPPLLLILPGSCW